ncbi:MAG: hypothetical protein OXE04_03295 [bacterium]|nr:hypothetical protein [bacterium]
MARRRDRVAPPPPKGGWDCRFANNNAATSWEQISATAPNNVRKAWKLITTDPLRWDKRQQPLKGRLATAVINHKALPQWQYEVTGGGRIWYCVDKDTATVWLTAVHIGHPKATE